MDRKAKLQQKLRNKREADAQVQAQAKAQREAQAEPKLTKKEKDKAKKQRQKKAKKEAEAKEGGYYVDKPKFRNKLGEMLARKYNYKIEKENALIELTIEYNKRNSLKIPIGKGEIDRAKKMKSSTDYQFIGEYFQKNLDDPMVMDEAYEEYGRRMKEIPRRWKEETDGIQRQILLNQEKRKDKLKGGKMGEIPKPRTEEETKERGKEIAKDTDESSFLMSELGRLEERSAKNRLSKYQVRNDFNQPNEEKFGKDVTGNPRSRREFAHRFRGKSEAQVSDMIDQEVRDRTPEQRGAFLQRATGTLKGQDITDDGVLQAGGNRVGAGEFIASQLAKKDIEQIVPEPSKRGFISAEFTPDNMRKTGAISQEEEGVIGIRQRREQQYIKEWSADGTTMKSTGLATLDQEIYTDFQEREDALLNAVAGNLQSTFFNKRGDKAMTIKEEAKQQFEEQTEGSEIFTKSTTNPIKIQTEFRNTDTYLQTQRNYAIQKEFIDVIQKSQQAEQIFSQYQLNNQDFISTGNIDSPYVDTDLNFNGRGGYEFRFNELLSEGQQPLQFLLNTYTNEILKFAGDNMMSGDGADNNVGDIAVVNEVNMGGRIAFIGHTKPNQSNPVPFGVGEQGGNFKGASYGYMSVFGNPYEENAPLIKQNQFLPNKDLNLRTFHSYTQRQFGDVNITGMDIKVTVAKDKGFKRNVVPTSRGDSEEIYLTNIQERKPPKTKLDFTPNEQIRKGTFLPKNYQPEDQKTLRKQLRTRQLNAYFNLSTTALKQKSRIGLQGMR